MLKVVCSTCDREIEEADGGETRIVVGALGVDLDGEPIPEYLYWEFADEDGEPTDKHLCRACLVSFLTDEAPERSAGIDLSSLGKSEEGDDDEAESVRG